MKSIQLLLPLSLSLSLSLPPSLWFCYFFSIFFYCVSLFYTFSFFLVKFFFTFSPFQWIYHLSFHYFISFFFPSLFQFSTILFFFFTHPLLVPTIFPTLSPLSYFTLVHSSFFFFFFFLPLLSFTSFLERTSHSHSFRFEIRNSSRIPASMRYPRPWGFRGFALDSCVGRTA